MLMMTDEQGALFMLFEITHHKEVACQFMMAEREALVAMLAVRANATRKAAHVAAKPAAVAMDQEAAWAGEVTAEVAARKEMARDRTRAGMRTWRRQGAPVRSTSSRTSAATASVWHAATPRLRARSMARDPSPPMLAGRSGHVDG
jgi:hypothetical protein